MSDTEIIEILCKIQDMIKRFKLFAENEKDIIDCEEFEDVIQSQFKNLCVN